MQYYLSFFSRVRLKYGHKRTYAAKCCDVFWPFLILNAHFT